MRIINYSYTIMTTKELKTECQAKAKELFNTFYQPLGDLGCNVNSSQCGKTLNNKH